MKVALLTCIAFTTGVCWLVNQVSRQPESPEPRRGVPTTLMSTTVPPTDRLSRPSASEASRIAPEPAPTVTARIEPAPTPPESESIALPPIVRPIETPAIAANVPDERAGGGAGEVMHVAQVSHVDAVPPAPGPAIVEPTLYKVAKGDSLSRICARTYGVDSPEVRRAVFELNPKIAKRPNCLYAGETLKLPVLPSDAEAAPLESPRPATTATIALQPEARAADAAALRPVDGSAIALSGSAKRDAKSSAIESVANATRDSFTQRPANSPAGSAKKDAGPNSKTVKKPPAKPAAKTATKTPQKNAVKTVAAKPAAGAPKSGSTRNASAKRASAKGSTAKTVAANSAGATKASKPAPAKSKVSKGPPAVAKDAKRSSSKPARESGDKPVTRRRGGTIDAG